MSQQQIVGGGPAFPSEFGSTPTGKKFWTGMTLREYAAIKLKVPNSGTDWLDAMIREGLRDSMAAKVIQSELIEGIPGSLASQDAAARYAYEMADAMMRARGGAA